MITLPSLPLCHTSTTRLPVSIAERPPAFLHPLPDGDMRRGRAVARGEEQSARGGGRPVDWSGESPDIHVCVNMGVQGVKGLST